jgi:fluoroacetyl-CoA thioesterase
MRIETLQPGLRHTQTIVVDEHLTVPAVSRAFTGFADMPEVFATAFLVGFVEWTCIEALKPLLPAGIQTVGVHVDLSHGAATPVGMRVTAEVTLAEVDGRRLVFHVRCRDEVDLVCEGVHERALIDGAKFRARVARKQGAA